MPSKIASHEGASSLAKESLNNWSLQNIAGSTSSIGKWNKLIILICWYSSNREEIVTSRYHGSTISG